MSFYSKNIRKFNWNVVAVVVLIGPQIFHIILITSLIVWHYPNEI